MQQLLTVSKLTGNWITPQGLIYEVRKAQDTSNRFLSLEFQTKRFYPEPFGFSSECFDRVEKWHRFDSKSFNKLITDFELKKI